MAEKNTSTLLILTIKFCCGRMAKWYEISLFGLEEVGVQVQIPAGLLPVFFFVVVLNYFVFFHRILTVWLVSVYSHC